MPFILVAIVFAIIFLDPIIPLVGKQFLYAISLSIKDIIVMTLPFIIFGLLFKAVVMLSKSATKIMVMILVFVCVSNFFSTFLSHYVGIWVYNFNLSIILPKNHLELNPLWLIDLPKLIANDKAMFAGIIIGIVFSKAHQIAAHKVAVKIEVFINKVLQSFSYFIPLFVAGFVVKLQYDGVIWLIVKDYTAIFVVIALAQYSYIGLLYFLLSNRKFGLFIQSIKNMLPAAISGFTSMSSAASMPLMIVGVESNAKNKDIIRSVVPMTINIHLIGDCFAIPILAYAIIKSFGMAEPSLFNYLIFTCYFVLAKFSVAAIPGGGILVMLPILSSYLDFDASMLSLITSLYILFDPVITCANVFGNGAFAKMIDKYVSYFNLKK